MAPFDNPIGPNLYGFGFLSTLTAIHFPTGTTGAAPVFVTDVSLFMQVVDGLGVLGPGNFVFSIIASTGGPKFTPIQQSSLLSVNLQGNRVANFQNVFNLVGVGQGAGTAAFFLVMEFNGAFTFGAAITVSSTTKLTITTRPAPGSSGPTTTNSYPLDNSQFPFGSLFVPANIVPPPASPNTQWFVVGLSPQSNGKFVIAWQHGKWLPQAPH
jgi:hypothetical protein